jgi:hypothetical protein
MREVRLTCSVGCYIKRRTLNMAVATNTVDNPNSIDFGLITSKTGNRTVQMALQYVF